MTEAIMQSGIWNAAGGIMVLFLKRRRSRRSPRYAGRASKLSRKEEANGACDSRSHLAGLWCNARHAALAPPQPPGSTLIFHGTTYGTKRVALGPPPAARSRCRLNLW